jgi:hypothetical protein
MAIIGKHFEERVIDRFLKPEHIMVGYEIPKTKGKYESIGFYDLSKEIKERIKEVIKFIENTDFPDDKSYAIKIFEVDIGKDKVEYLSNNCMQEAKRFTLLFLDKQSDSNGNQIYAIIRRNKVITAFFGKSYSMKNMEPKEKMRVDIVINDIKKSNFKL